MYSIHKSIESGQALIFQSIVVPLISSLILLYVSSSFRFTREYGEGDLKRRQ
jgi:hypothetical protein